MALMCWAKKAVGYDNDESEFYEDRGRKRWQTATNVIAVTRQRDKKRERKRNQFKKLVRMQLMLGGETEKKPKKKSQDPKSRWQKTANIITIGKPPKKKKKGRFKKLAKLKILFGGRVDEEDEDEEEVIPPPPEVEHLRFRAIASDSIWAYRLSKLAAQKEVPPQGLFNKLTFKKAALLNKLFRPNKIKIQMNENFEKLDPETVIKRINFKRLAKLNMLLGSHKRMSMVGHASMNIDDILSDNSDPNSDPDDSFDSDTEETLKSLSNEGEETDVDCSLMTKINKMAVVEVLKPEIKPKAGRRQSIVTLKNISTAKNTSNLFNPAKNKVTEESKTIMEDKSASPPPLSINLNNNQFDETKKNNEMNKIERPQPISQKMTVIHNNTSNNKVAPAIEKKVMVKKVHRSQNTSPTLINNYVQMEIKKLELMGKLNPRKNENLTTHFDFEPEKQEKGLFGKKSDKKPKIDILKDEIVSLEGHIEIFKATIAVLTEELREIAPIVKAAHGKTALPLKAINQLKGVRMCPPKSIQLVMAAICIFKRLDPDVTFEGIRREVMLIDYWSASQKLLSGMLVEELRDLRKPGYVTPEAIVEFQETIIPDVEFDRKKIERAFPFCAQVYDWILRVEQFGMLVAHLNLLKKEEKLNENNSLLNAANQKLEKMLVKLEKMEKKKKIDPERIEFKKKFGRTKSRRRMSIVNPNIPTPKNLNH